MFYQIHCYNLTCSCLAYMLYLINSAVNANQQYLFYRQNACWIWSEGGEQHLHGLRTCPGGQHHPLGWEEVRFSLFSRNSVMFSNIGTMGLAHFPVSTLLLETPGTHGICVKGLSTMIAKSFKDKQVYKFITAKTIDLQVFVSSDLEEEDPSFWQQLFAEIKPHLEPLFLEKRMETVSIS